MKAETLKRKLDELELKEGTAHGRTVYLWVDDPDKVPDPPEDAGRVVYYSWQTEDTPEPEA